MTRNSSQTLADPSSLFDGTAAGDSVTLTARGMTGTAIPSVGGPHLAVGERYLVGGDEGRGGRLRASLGRDTPEARPTAAGDAAPESVGRRWRWLPRGQVQEDCAVGT